jgi:hypothetical protein
MHPLVRDLYKRFILAGRSYPQGVSAVREKVKKAFADNGALHDDISIKKAVSKGRWWVREVVAIGQLHKYRAMKNRYDPPDR